MKPQQVQRVSGYSYPTYQAPHLSQEAHYDEDEDPQRVQGEQKKGFPWKVTILSVLGTVAVFCLAAFNGKRHMAEQLKDGKVFQNFLLERASKTRGEIDREAEKLLQKKQFEESSSRDIVTWTREKEEEFLKKTREELESKSNKLVKVLGSRDKEKLQELALKEGLTQKEFWDNEENYISNFDLLFFNVKRTVNKETNEITFRFENIRFINPETKKPDNQVWEFIKSAFVGFGLGGIGINPFDKKVKVLDNEIDKMLKDIPEPPPKKDEE